MKNIWVKSGYDLTQLDRIKIDGIEHEIGDVRDFFSQPEMRQFVPENAKLGLAWVRLREGETHSLHVHPVNSMLFICKGEAEVLGPGACTVKEGDIVLIPADIPHGFRGKGALGFSGISFQFEQRGLFESGDEPLIKFQNNVENELPIHVTNELNSVHSISELLLLNSRFKVDFRQNVLFKKMSTGWFSNEKIRQLFLDYFQGWSNYFQNSVMLKAALCNDTRFYAAFQTHFMEEIHHNISLSDFRKKREPKKDSVLEAVGSWFTLKMITSSQAEKVVIMHMCVEGSADIFYEFARPVFDPEKKSAHFKSHEEIDKSHELLGTEQIENLNAVEYARLSEVLADSWGMMNTLFSRISDLT